MSAVYQDEKIKLHQGDVLAWALDYKAQIDKGEALPFHAILCDPPYGLGDPPPIEKLLTAWLAGDDFTGFSKGFMGKVWDVLPSPQVWRALLDVCFPGAYLFAFSGTRTADLLGVACRLGGWEPFDRVTNFMWAYGSGFPKSHNLSKALDAEAGAEREVVGRQKALGNARGKGAAGHYANDIPSISQGGYEIVKDGWDITAPATPLAQAFDGFGSALKPSGEPILLFRKPREGRTFAECARRDGSGGLNIGATRVNPGSSVPGGGRSWGASDGVHEGWKRKAHENYTEDTPPHSAGRWPPNTHFTHVPPTGPCPTCHGSGFVESPPFTESFESWYAKTKDYGGTREEWQRLCESGGTSGCDECHGRGVTGGCRRVGTRRVKGSNFQGHPDGRKNAVYGKDDSAREPGGYADSDGHEQVADWACVEGCPILALDEMAGERASCGGPKTTTHDKGMFGIGQPGRVYKDGSNASRFYPNHDWSYEIAERLAGETPFRYVPKASRGERDAGLEHMPAQHPPKVGMNRLRCATCNGWQNTGDTVAANRPNSTCHCEVPDFEPQTGRVQDVRNTGPCVKPLSLARWLGALACPPPQFKPRLCVPFAGTGSEIIGAILSGGWAEIHGIERELEYIEIAAARIAWWSKWAKLTDKTDPAEIRKLGEAAETKEAWQGDERQTSMFDAIGE